MRISLNLNQSISLVLESEKVKTKAWIYVTIRHFKRGENKERNACFFVKVIFHFFQVYFWKAS